MYIFTSHADCLTTTLLMSSVVDAVSGAIQIVLISQYQVWGQDLPAGALIYCECFYGKEICK